MIKNLQYYNRRGKDMEELIALMKNFLLKYLRLVVRKN